MIDEIRKQLIELARLKQTWSYSQLNNQLQLNLNFESSYDRDLIGNWLGEISIYEYQRNRPLLSSLIVHKSKNREQGDGFFKLCESLYHRNWVDLKADKNFEIDRIAECFSYWKNNEHYKKFKDDF
ncbi:hypothetical protein H3Z85_07990 [Chryseobacterium indologenes]|uniref:hypothetical protein n=1 Tax=Chryseobacterium indologenes TaxID=253 RepID=UPI0003E065A3|nr:hypothetical protein [Chryseobacterium indologenes]QPQ53278.1 hypothetical protein H3Z85_07990 [Chryseobacterium indologenes]GAE63574.1 hypothetical protein CIN01S_04_01800 [Chryseobacterium indologenes NBRC 14944]SFJ64437.1 hypothetical protein SAMN05421692_2235 [Chryseobacterium indologenes]SUX52100.1 Uncharacterised protein [Chryseobacterium indologenes]